MVLWSHLPFTVGFHQFAEWSVPLDFKLHHRAILPRHLQVDMLIVLSLHSLLVRGRARERGGEREQVGIEKDAFKRDGKSGCSRTVLQRALQRILTQVKV